MMQLAALKKPTPPESPPKPVTNTTDFPPVTDSEPGKLGKLGKTGNDKGKPGKFRIPEWHSNTKPNRQSLAFVVGQYLPSADNPREGTLMLSHGVYPAVVNQKVNLSKLGEEQRLFRAWLRQEDRRFRFEIVNYGDIPEGHQDHAIIAGLFWNSYPKSFKILVKPHPHRQVESFKIAITGRCRKSKYGDIVRVGCLLSDRGLMAIMSEDLRKPPPAISKAALVSEKKKPQVNKEGITLTAAKMELTLKINQMPAGVKTVEKGWRHFELDCDGRVVSITIKPKQWRKLSEAQENYPMWVAAIAGKMGQQTEKGFILDQPNIQVFEKKPKPPKEGE